MSGVNQKFIGLTVCVNYADLLELTIDNNKRLFDRYVVATDRFDDETYRLCEENGVECIRTNAFYHANAKFNKARALNILIEGIGDPQDWYCTVDADILLAEGIEKRSLQTNKLYAMERYDCYSRNKLEEFKEKGFEVLVKPDENCYSREGNKIPIGFFFLWHGKKFFSESKDASKYDINFSFRWRQEDWVWTKRCVHLCDTLRITNFDINWEGRRTVRFK